MRSDISGTVATRFSVSETAHLQDLIDELSSPNYIPDETGRLNTFNRNRFRGGVEIHLQKGTYDCDITINNPGVTIRGDGSNQTEINGKVTVYAAFTQMYDLAIRGVGKPYALRVQRNPAAGYGNISRCRFENLIVGGSYWSPSHPSGTGAPGGPIDGPTNAIEIDGVYLTDFKHVTAAFASQDGWHIEATNILYPSTTLGFTDCSGVKNGRYGVYAKGPCNGFHMLRGNVEQNGIYGVAPTFNLNPDGTNCAEMYLESMTNIHVQNVDFEGNIPMQRVIFVTSSNCGLFTGNSFFYEDSTAWNPANPKVSKFIEMATSFNFHIHGNRTQGLAAGRIAQADDRCSQIEFTGHGYADATNQHIKNFGTGSPLWNSYR